MRALFCAQECLDAVGVDARGLRRRDLAASGTRTERDDLAVDLGHHALDGSRRAARRAASARLGTRSAKSRLMVHLRAGHERPPRTPARPRSDCSRPSRSRISSRALLERLRRVAAWRESTLQHMIPEGRLDRLAGRALGEREGRGFQLGRQLAAREDCPCSRRPRPRGPRAGLRASASKPSGPSAGGAARRGPRSRSATRIWRSATRLGLRELRARARRSRRAISSSLTAGGRDRVGEQLLRRRAAPLRAARPASAGRGAAPRAPARAPRGTESSSPRAPPGSSGVSPRASSPARWRSKSLRRTLASPSARITGSAACAGRQASAESADARRARAAREPARAPHQSRS